MVFPPWPRNAHSHSRRIIHLDSKEFHGTNRVVIGEQLSKFTANLAILDASDLQKMLILPIVMRLKLYSEILRGENELMRKWGTDGGALHAPGRSREASARGYGEAFGGGKQGREGNGDEMTDWQPIETAPKDGEMIILYPNWRIAWWEFGDEEWMYDAVPFEIKNGEHVLSHRPLGEPGPFCCRYANAVAPTHWMPLPEPPQAHEPATPNPAPR